jgi:putative oxidoreductase
MKAILHNPLFQLIARLVLGGVFLVAAIDKIAVPDAFAKSINNYHIVPTYLVNISALLLPWLELLCSIFLITGIRVKASALITSGMLVVFIVAIISAMMRGLDINCGCFSQAGVAPTKVGWGKVAEDVGLLVLGIALIISNGNTFSFESLVEKNISSNSSSQSTETVYSDSI